MASSTNLHILVILEKLRAFISELERERNRHCLVHVFTIHSKIEYCMYCINIAVSQDHVFTWCLSRACNSIMK